MNFGWGPEWRAAFPLGSHPRSSRIAEGWPPGPRRQAAELGAAGEAEEAVAAAPPLRISERRWGGVRWVEPA